MGAEFGGICTAQRRGHGRVKDLEQNFVVACAHLAREVEGERRVPALMLAQAPAVDPHFGEVVDGAEMNQLPAWTAGAAAKRS